MSLCPTGKIPFGNQRTAQSRWKWARKVSKLDMREYKCRECGYWHLYTRK